jgi:hypothetical protein
MPPCASSSNTKCIDAGSGQRAALAAASRGAHHAAVNDLVLQSILTCPHCGMRMVETMPLDACVFFHPCSGCNAMLQPGPGDCCVFCSHGDVACPPVQQLRPCCGREGA